MAGSGIGSSIYSGGVQLSAGGNDPLKYLSLLSQQQAQNGLSPQNEAAMRSSLLGGIDQRFNELQRANTQNLSSAGLTSSGLSAIAGSKLAGKEANAITDANARIANLDYQAKQQGLANLFKVFGGEQQILNRREGARQFDQRLAAQKDQFNRQLAFQKDQAKYNWGDFFGDIFGAAGQIGAGFALHSDRRLKENIKKVDEVDGINVYEFTYIGQPDKKYTGVIAQEIKDDYPDAVFLKDGYYAVDYSQIPVDMKEVA